MLQRKYFEIFASVGRPSAPDKDFPYSEDALLSDMAYARIHGAALMHNGAKDYSFEFGNCEALKIANENPRLVSLAIVPSTATLETGNDNYFNDLLDSGVRGFVTLHKSLLCGSLEPKSMSRIAEALITHNRPLIAVDVNCEERYDKIDKLAQAYPELSIIMQGTSWGTNRFFWEVMEKNENLHFEITSNHTNKIIELTKKQFGIERVLYSSAWPIKSMGAMKSMIEYADIFDADKNLVAHGNACRLFGLSADSLELYDDSKCEFDEIAWETDAGIAISVPVIDAHSHIVGEGYAVNNNIMIATDPASITEKMLRLGIDTTITAPWTGICYDGIQGNEETLTASRNHPGKFLGFSTCNVNYKEDLKAVKEYHENHPDLFVGIKPYPPSQKFRLTDDVCKDWFTYANEHHLMALIHAESVDYTEQTDIISDIYPNVTFILAHSGASYYIARKNAEVVRKHDNVVLDITYTTTGRGMIEFLVNEVGADKVIYGSDMPMRDPSPQLGWVCYAQIPLEDKKKILAGNIQSLMKQRV